MRMKSRMSMQKIFCSACSRGRRCGGTCPTTSCCRSRNREELPRHHHRLPQPGTGGCSQNLPETVPAPVASAIDPDKKALILKFIDVFGTRQALINNFELMLQQIEKEKPDEAQKIRERVKVDDDHRAAACLYMTVILTSG